ncbi:uncharacterized protein LOC123258971 [Cotesia glomerata]|uniref:uncharacterized protein LOC123258971 n=1 Tax=Cotesia glomerata TaxID=32391 RepID=UPI001D01C74C|nr:uncharacterized protein LOC123258971 [Cotesia glomerata]
MQLEPSNLFLNNIELHQSNNLKILGMYFDKSLTWNNHITELKRQCHQRLNLLKSIASTKWGADTQILINTYRSIIRSKLDYGCTIYQFASNHHLKKLNSIQTTSLRIALGAYRTSPRLSLLAESGETPLDLRRTQLSLNFACSAPSIIPELHQNHPQRPPNFNNEKPTEIRAFLINSTNNNELQNLTLYNPQYSQIPYWKTPTECYDLSIHEQTWGKDNTPDALFKNLYLEISNQLEQFTQIFTDGSIINNQRGCAIVINDSVYKYKLPSSYSIFSCEAYAILQSLKLIVQIDITKAAIFTDSKSAIEALLNSNSTDNIIQECQTIIYNTRLTRDIRIIWIPSHQGILGNELADKEAKNATVSGIDLTSTLLTTATDFKKKVKNHITTKWNDLWINGQSHLHLIRENTMETRPQLEKRTDQCQLNRLRIGHTVFSHSHLLSKTNLKPCPACNQPASVNHILTTCSQLNILRSQHQIPANLQTALNSENVYPRIINLLKQLQLLC